VPNYWILDGYAESLECLVLEGGKYRRDALGRKSDEVRATLFPGLAIPLTEIWTD
jgi:Uma2 family endonuclease